MSDLAWCGVLSDTRSLQKPKGLLRRADFLRVQSAGRRFRGALLTLLLLPTAGPTRIGYTVSRKVGGSVVRNRVRRRLREIVRLHQHLLAPDSDVVVIAAPKAAFASYAALEAELTVLLERARQHRQQGTSRGYDAPTENRQ